MSEKLKNLIVGSSPLTLLFARVLARTQGQTAIVDRASTIGGAWATETCFGLDGVETSPHIFMPSRKGYRIMNELIPTPLDPWPLEPEILIRDTVSKKVSPFRISDQFGRNQHPRKLALANAPRNKRHKYLFRYAKGMAMDLPKLFKRKSVKTIYPRGGLNNMFADMKNVLADDNVDMFLNTEITRLGIKENFILVDCSDGRSFEVENLYATPMFDLPDVHFGDEPVMTNTRNFVSQHFTVLIEDNNLETSRFLLLDGDPMFELISDVTRYTSGLKENQRVITCRLRATEFYFEQDAKFLFNALKEFGVIFESAQYVNHHLKNLREVQIANRDMKRLHSLSEGKIEFLEVGGLSVVSSIKRYCEIPLVE